MIKEMIGFAKENNLSPFNRTKTSVRSGQSIFKTIDARAIHNKVLAKISENFCFSETSNFFHFFKFANFDSIKLRQEFFKSISRSENIFLSNFKVPKVCWKPRYDVVVVTEEEDTLLALHDMSVPVQFINNPEDVSSLEGYDIIQVLNCEQSSRYLEQLPQTVFLNSIEEVYLERYLEVLSGWRDNLILLEQNSTNEEIKRIIFDLKQFFRFFSESGKTLSREEADVILEGMNEKIMGKIKEMTLSGDSLINILSKSKFPEEISKMIQQEIKNTGLPEEIFNISIPLSIDDNEFSKYVKIQSATKFTDSAEAIKKYAKELRLIPEKLQELSYLVLIFDFLSGVSKFMHGNFPEYDENFFMKDSKNVFLDNAQPVSFHLDNSSRCSVLTGANSGGKTTLLEHIIQLISLYQLGFPVSGDVKMPVFSEVYYFAKNKGSMSKGAFETLLTQMAGIQPGKRTLILADEMEAVTEPGVAGNIVCATAKYFIEKDCFLVIATHLGQEIQKNLPAKARIDGIEAKGLDENNELIVDHNPVLGRLANSTPELIVERLAKKQGFEYFKFLHEELSTA